MITALDKEAIYISLDGLIKMIADGHKDQMESMNPHERMCVIIEILDTIKTYANSIGRAGELLLDDPSCRRRDEC